MCSISQVIEHEVVQQQQPKWEGLASTDIKGPKAEQIWPLLEDFFGLNKWFPTLTTCLPAEGINGQPGCVRYCEGFKTPIDDKKVKKEEEVINWTKQKLLSIDPTEMTFSYSIIDGNVGFNGYVSTLKVFPKEDGCRVEWKYEVEPVNEWRLEDLDFFIGTGLQVMAERMTKALQSQGQDQP